MEKNFNREFDPKDAAPEREQSNDSRKTHFSREDSSERPVRRRRAEDSDNQPAGDYAGNAFTKDRRPRINRQSSQPVERNRNSNRDGHDEPNFNRERNFNRDNRSNNSEERPQRFRSFNHEGNSDNFNRDRSDRGPYEHKRSFDRNDRSERAPQNRNFNRDRDFNRDSESGERRSFNRPRQNDRDFNRERNFNRDENPNRERNFNRDENRSERPSFNRERPAFNRERPAFNRDRNFSHDRNFNRERPSNRDENPNRERNYNRDENPNRERNFNRDENRGERPFRKPSFNPNFNENNRRRPNGDRPDYERRPGRFDRDNRERRNDDSRRPFLKTTREKKFDKDNYPKYTPTDIPDTMRLNRFISMSGICSRREADELIKQGLVSVNGQVITELGVKINRGDDIVYNGQHLQGEKKVYILMNKPKGYVTTVEDPNADKTVMDLISGACSERVYPVGRLDKNTLGVLLITNDGDLTKKLTHPSFDKKKIYHVHLNKNITAADMQKIADGVELEDGVLQVDEVAYVDDTKQDVGLEIHSGRNRVVRRLFEALGYSVDKLDRVYFAGLTKKNLPRGKWRFLTQVEVNLLKSGSYE